MTDGGMVNLARIYYPVTVLGPGKRVGIWLAGCDRNCPGCISPELKTSSSGTYVEVTEIMKNIQKLCSDAEGFTISGGEPFTSPEGLCALVREISKMSEDIIIFTGYRLSELMEMRDDNVDYILDNISVLVDGPYIEALNDGRGLRGSSNQNIHVFKNAKRYVNLSDCERSLQVVVNNDRVMTIGMPVVNEDD
ncbi:MAG: radical SAM protein [Lachnospiraceae bacterium]|nr:radical SAM protein [Lachnospiraceae bacterium]